MSLEEVLSAFYAEVYNREEGADPEDRFEWDSVMFGFALAKGCTVEVANEASYKWYNHCSSQ